MKFEWDKRKAASNLTKHGVSFELAMTIFFDPHHLSVPDGGTNEERWVTIGVASNQKTLLAVHTYTIEVEGKEQIRLISARKATKRERKQYEEGV